MCVYCVQWDPNTGTLRTYVDSICRKLPDLEMEQNVVRQPFSKTKHIDISNITWIKSPYKGLYESDDEDDESDFEEQISLNLDDENGQRVWSEINEKIDEIIQEETDVDQFHCEDDVPIRKTKRKQKSSLNQPNSIPPGQFSPINLPANQFSSFGQ